MSDVDPASLLHKQVKIHSVSAKPELNSKIGIAESYLPDRNRYLVSLPAHISPAPVALKADNLIEATIVDKAKGKVDQVWGMIVGVYHDENVREVLRRGVAELESRLPPNVKVVHAAGGILLVLIGIIYFTGLSKTIMLVSLVAMGAVVALPDIMAKRDFKSMAKNFPFRWKEAIEQNTGFRPSQRVASGILVGIVVLSGKVLVTSRSRASPGANAGGAQQFGGGASRRTSSSGGITNENMGAFTMEDVYKLGFQDAQNESPFGESLPSDHASMNFKSSSSSTTSTYNFDDYADYNDYLPPPQPKKSKMGMGTVMSLFALGREVKELGFADGRFDLRLFQANAMNLPPLKKGFVAFMLYRVLSAFM
jgi:hypothetical protein